MSKYAFQITAAVAAVVLGLGSTVGTTVLLANMETTPAPTVQLASQAPVVTLEKIVVVGERS